MASKYSNYELKPYVSTYTNPYSVEVNTLLRERYDQNKAKVDLIDQTLGAKQTLEGDRIHIDNAKSMVKTRFENLTRIGDYENAGLVVSEVINELESDRGLQLAQKSWMIREEELKYVREAKLKGLQMLDFGQGSINQHQSYFQDNEGAWVENVYEPLTEQEHMYSEHIQSLIKGIKADSSGVSQGKADRIARGLLPTYLDNFVGDQHYRKLTQIEGMSDQEAKATILKEIESVTDQYVHHIQTKANLDGGKSLLEYFSGKGQSPDGSVSFSLKGDDVGNYLLDMNKQILGATDYSKLTTEEKNSTNRFARESYMVEMGALEGLLKSGKITQAQYNNHMKYGMNSFKNHYKLRNITNHYLSNEISSFEHTLQGEVNHYANILPSIGITTTIALARRLQGKKMSTKSKILLLTSAYAGSELYSYGKRALNEQSNVRTAGNHIQQLLSGNSELEQLIENINDTEYLAKKGVVHPVTGEEYNIADPEYKALVEVIKANYSYRTELGGDDVYNLIENYSGDIFTGNVHRPTDTKSGKEIRTILNSGETRFNPRNYNWLMLDEDSPAFNTQFFGDDGEMLSGTKTGFVAGSFESGVPGYIEFQIGSKEHVQYAEDKPSATGEGLSQVESGFMLINQADKAAHTHAFPILTRMEKYNEGSGKTKGVTRNDQVIVLAEAFEFVMNNYDGHQNLVSAELEGMAFATNFMQGQFEAAHPGITLEIMQSFGYETADPTQVPKEILEQAASIYLDRYNQFLELEIKRWND